MQCYKATRVWTIVDELDGHQKANFLLNIALWTFFTFAVFAVCISFCSRPFCELLSTTRQWVAIIRRMSFNQVLPSQTTPWFMFNHRTTVRLTVRFQWVNLLQDPRTITRIVMARIQRTMKRLNYSLPALQDSFVANSISWISTYETSHNKFKKFT